MIKSEPDLDIEEEIGVNIISNAMNRRNLASEPLQIDPGSANRVVIKRVMEDEEMEEEESMDVQQMLPLRVRYCNVYGCLVNSATFPALELFLVPTTNSVRRKQWLKRIDREDLVRRDYRKSIFVCERHFRQTDIVRVATNKILKKTALPILDLVQLPVQPLDVPGVNVVVVGPTTLNKDKAVQVVPSVTENYAQTNSTNMIDATNQVYFESAEDYKKKINDEFTAAKKRLKLIENGSEKLKKEQFQQGCDQFLSPVLSELIKHQADLQHNSKGNRYGLPHKIFSLNLSFTSHKVYQMLEKDFCLPSKSRVRQIDVPVDTDISDIVLVALKIKVAQMTEREKFCAVTVGKMSLKGNLYYNMVLDKLIGTHDIDGSQKLYPAKYAVVVLVSGIFDDWMQPIGFAFLSETKASKDISRWIDKILLKLQETGLKVKAYIPPYETDFLEEAIIRNITIQKPYFYINNVKIYYIFNVPDLLKQLRNNFLTHNFIYHRKDGSVGIAKSEHVKDFHNRDKRKLKLAQKLTDDHIQPGIHQESLFLSAQLFSKSVATGLNTYIDFDVIDESARDTVEVLLLINDLFDLLNSSSLSSDHPYKTAFTGNDDQKGILDKSLTFFQSLKLTNAKTGETIIQGMKLAEDFQKTILAFVHLLGELQQEGLDGLLTRRLNLDIINNFFKAIRSKGDMMVKPTSQQFVMSFRKQYISHLLKQPKGRKFCTREMMKLLVAQSEYNDDEVDEDPGQSSKEKDNEKELNVTVTDFKDIKIANKNSSHEICSVILKRVVKKHGKCEQFRLFCDLYKVQGSQNAVVKSFNDQVALMEKEFQNAFGGVFMMSKLGVPVYERIMAIEFLPPCPCFPKKFFYKLFVKLRINMLLNYNNMMYRKHKHRASQIVIPTISDL